MLEAETETNEEEVTEEAYHDDKRSRVKDYKMPRRKTTRRRRLQKVMDYYSEDQTNEDNSDEVIDLIGNQKNGVFPILSAGIFFLFCQVLLCQSCGSCKN